MSNQESQVIYDTAMVNKSLLDQIPFQLRYSIKVKLDRPLFAAIPSGEGKTTLQSQDPLLFADWEQLLNKQQWVEFYRLLPDKNKWDEIDKLFSLTQIPTVNPNRIYLVHGFSHIPSHLKQNYLGAFLLNKGTNIRENAGNRESLMKESLVFFCPTFSARNEAIIERALQFLSIVQQ
ncbi:15229_t:CDS:2 [Gigaspora margarita]|uniref:15229_t:CDS:1 n=1 Tax=Gigaspora margarita TaxID=4874 RepID=A0ABM8VXC3_GIGMA|nr:15229_t:CDS:2 [Gigaspora margarita]